MLRLRARRFARPVARHGRAEAAAAGLVRDGRDRRHPADGAQRRPHGRAGAGRPAPVGRDRDLARAVGPARGGAVAGREHPRRAGGQLLPARRGDGALERRSGRAGRADGGRCRPAARDASTRRASCWACERIERSSSSSATAGHFQATERTSGPWDAAAPARRAAVGAAARRARADRGARGDGARADHGRDPRARCRSARWRSRRRSSGRGARSSCSRASCAPTGATCCARARGGCSAVAGRAPRRAEPVALPDAEDVPPPKLGEAFGYAHAVEWRWARGGWQDRGPAAVWTRMRIPLVEGEEPSPRQRVMVVADSGNGASNVLDWSTLPVHQHRADRALRARAGRRVGVPGRETRIAEGGAGLASRCSATGRDRLRAAHRRCSSRRDDAAVGPARA